MQRCSVSGCGAAAATRGMCRRHYKRALVAERDADLSVPRCRWAECGRAEAAHGYCDSHRHAALDLGIVGTPCLVADCPASARGRGLCARHLSRAKAYGLTAAELADAEAQVCEVCGSDQRQVVDHDHSTGVVRGVLCSWCNTAIGHAFDDPGRLRAMAAYLERYLRDE